jgi:HSP20 family protein
LKPRKSARKYAPGTAFIQLEEHSMHIIQRSPWQLISNPRSDADRYLRSEIRARRPFVPAVDIHEETDRFVVTADLPGVDAAAIEVTVDKGVLRLQGERKATELADGERVQCSERAAGRFERVFRLPETAANDGLEAIYANGVLTVSIPKAKSAMPYRIEVRAN